MLGSRLKQWTSKCCLWSGVWSMFLICPQWIRKCAPEWELGHQHTSSVNMFFLRRFFLMKKLSLIYILCKPLTSWCKHVLWRSASGSRGSLSVLTSHRISCWGISILRDTQEKATKPFGKINTWPRKGENPCKNSKTCDNMKVVMWVWKCQTVPKVRNKLLYFAEPTEERPLAHP
jgi:hypothetical protein